jgi:hypothetical protein
LHAVEFDIEGAGRAGGRRGKADSLWL